MRTVLSSHQEVAHYWANKNQPQGRSGNMLFEGDSIYSYGHHFEIARHVDSVILANSGGHSVSTSKHQSIVSNACNHIKKYVVPSFDNHNENVSHYIDLINRCKRELLRKRKYIILAVGHIEKLFRTMKEYVDYFSKKISIDYTNKAKSFFDNGLFTAEENAKIEAKYHREVENQSIEVYKERVKQIELKREAADKIIKWKNGEININGMHYLQPVLRVNNGNIETSWGVKVPTEKAKLLYLSIKKNILPERFEEFQVISNDENTLRIGCHKIDWSEINEIANKLNW